MAKIFVYPRSGALRQPLAAGDILDGQFSALPHPAPDAIDLTVATFLNLPSWARALLVLRDVLVRPLGIKTGGGHEGRIPTYDEIAQLSYRGSYQIYSATKDEVILGADDWHLDFRLSILRSVDDDLVAITLMAHPHNLAGRAYLAAILPFHRFLVSRCLANTANLGIVAA